MAGVPLTLIVAAIAAAAIFLIAIGIATSGSGSAVSNRLERYASGKDPTANAAGGGIAEMISQSVALASLNRVVEQRDFGANLARDIARADLKLKPSEFLMIWGGAIIGVPVLMFIFSFFSPALGSPRTTGAAPRRCCTSTRPASCGACSW